MKLLVCVCVCAQTECYDECLCIFGGGKRITVLAKKSCSGCLEEMCVLGSEFSGQESSSPVSVPVVLPKTSD